VVRLREINRETNEELLAPLDEQERAQLAELIGRVVRHHTGEPDPAAGRAASGAGGRTDPAEEAGAPSGRAESAGRTVATARSEAEEDGVREVPVMPGHPERAREPYDPDREADRARRHTAESLRP
jgi:hypothetical protein